MRKRIEEELEGKKQSSNRLLKSRSCLGTSIQDWLGARVNKYPRK
jgi:hypothetical protein